jgi:hypothetical protein
MSDAQLRSLERKWSRGQLSEFELGLARQRVGRCPMCGGPMPSLAAAAIAEAFALGANDVVGGAALVCVCGWSVTAGWSCPSDPRPGDPARVIIAKDSIAAATVLKRTPKRAHVRWDQAFPLDRATGRWLFWPDETKPTFLATLRADGVWRIRRDSRTWVVEFGYRRERLPKPWKREPDTEA